MRGFGVTVQRCFLESPGDYLVPVFCFLLETGWPLCEDFGHIWTLTEKKRGKRGIKFASVLQRAVGLRTALTDRLLLSLSLSANAAPYGIFLS